MRYTTKLNLGFLCIKFLQSSKAKQFWANVQLSGTHRVSGKFSWKHLHLWLKLQSVPATLSRSAPSHIEFSKIHLHCMVSLTEAVSAHRHPSSSWHLPEAWLCEQSFIRLLCLDCEDTRRIFLMTGFFEHKVNIIEGSLNRNFRQYGELKSRWKAQQ